MRQDVMIAQELAEYDAGEPAPVVKRLRALKVQRQQERQCEHQPTPPD